MDPAPDDDLDTDLDAVTAVPPSSGMSFRGPGADWWQVGSSYDEPGWLRTSRDPRIATANFASPDVVAVFGATGRDLLGIGEYPEEQETAFLPGSRFTLLRQGTVGALWVSVVVVHRDDHHAELDLHLDEQVRRAAIALERGRTAPPAVLARPGRFLGPFGVDPDAPS